MSQLHYFCPLCTSPNILQHYPTLFAHIRHEYRHKASFNIRCELSILCESRYSSFDSYRCHIYHCHRSLFDPIDNDDNISSNINNTFDNVEDLLSDLSFNSQSQYVSDFESSVYPDEELDETELLFSSFKSISFPFIDQQVNFDKLARFYTNFFLELREHYLLPQKIVQLILSTICKLFDMILKLIKTKMSSLFLSVTDFEAAFARVILMSNVISKNEYRFLKQCEKHFNYQPPTKIVLNPPNELAYYVPLKQSLSDTLQNDQLLQAIIENINYLSNRAAEDKDLVLSNRQGHFEKTNLQRQTNSNVLLLKLYTDEISITNPLGPHKDSQKFTCFYYL